jgi:hypothetical protein
VTIRLRPRATRPTRAGRLFSDARLLVALALAMLAVVPPDRRDLRRIAWVTALLFAMVMVRRLIGPGARPPIAARPDPEPPAAGAAHLTQLSRLTGSVETGATSMAKFDLTVRPLLHRIAGERLMSRHGIDLRRDSDAAAARARLGDDLWQLFARTGPSAYDAPAPALDQVQRWISAVERI